MNRLNYILFLYLLAFAVVKGKAQSTTTTAVPFLRMPIDARASGMASTGIASPADASALFLNTGKLPFSREKGMLTAHYAPLLKEWANDMYLASLGGFYKLNEQEALHGLVRYFNPGDVQFTDESGNNLQAYHPREFALDLGYARKLSERMGLGLTVRYIRSNLAKGGINGEQYQAGNSVAADLGFYYDLRNEQEEGFSLGAQLSNLGTKMSYTKTANNKAFLPANLGVGAS